MAVQSLYRRYRPRTFAELKGQDHVVRALRNAVLHEREGHAYLFSGPRGTGKTSTARILAKVLNCTAPAEGEPCGACESCLAVDAGTSYDVLELDAASNNGVDDMRDLIERAALGNPGRHRVFILDEVHMLSKPAEAALLKTLEEPPGHVVFVLATTDPQKVSETIRSRTQHLQFHLLPLATMREHVRWVVGDAGLEVPDDALDRVVEQGGGSVRDTLSALEVAVASGGTIDAAPPVDEFVDALAAHAPRRALAAGAGAGPRGADPRGLAEEIVRHLRDCFLSIVAPELVQLPAERADRVAERARRLGVGAVVRAIETIGTVLVEIRHAPDPRLLLEVALVRLTSAPAGSDLTALAARVERLEQSLAAPRDPSGALARPTPVDETGRARLGGRAAAPATPVQPPASGPLSDADVVARWPEVLGALRSIVRALYSAITPVSCADGVLVLGAPSDAHASRATEHLDAVTSVVRTLAGRDVSLRMQVVARGGSPRPSAPRRATRPSSAPRDAAPPAHAEADDAVDPRDVVAAPPAHDAVMDDVARVFPGAKVVRE
ncbi:MAG: DNA polymerase III subunit gamma/tau [Ilumatobacteraceae bacterium]